MMGQYEEALKEYKRALEIDSRHAYAHYDIGLIYEKWGMMDKAKKEFNIAYKLKSRAERLKDQKK
jgi:tetratricopeptide (TPR) repeat protein